MVGPIVDCDVLGSVSPQTSVPILGWACYLMLNPGRVLSKSQILDHVWDYDFRGEMNIVESYISYLRRKIDVVGEPLIHTKRGVGYVLKEQ